MIASCPSCGTHYKHEAPRQRVRARCGRCDTTLELTSLRPYRIVTAASFSPDGSVPPARQRPMGLEDPSLESMVSRDAVRHPAHEMAPTAPPPVPEAIPTAWEDEDPLPQIPEMKGDWISQGEAPSAPEDAILGTVPAEPIDEGTPAAFSADGVSPEDGGAAAFFLWVATGAIAGTGVSWTMGGTTLTGLASGAVLGTMAGWGWLRWTSPK